MFIYFGMLLVTIQMVNLSVQWFNWEGRKIWHYENRINAFFIFVFVSKYTQYEQDLNLVYSLNKDNFYIEIFLAVFPKCN